MHRFPQFARDSQLDKTGCFPLKPLSAPPPNPPQVPSVAQLRRLASSFRRNQTSSERWLWDLLRGKQLSYRFRRQYVVAGYIVDFYCPKIHLAVEIDGPFHHSRAGQTRANVRDEVLLHAGISQILHFHDSMPPSEMFRQIEDALRGKSTVKKQTPTRLSQPFPPQSERLDEREPRLADILAERNPRLADLITELANRKRMA
jgi:very-short-patch-repair endonuclease